MKTDRYLQPIVVRPGFYTTIMLPTDLTVKESNRIARILRSLSIKTKND